MRYLEELTIRLAHGVSHLREDFRERHAAFFKSKQHHDGGFPGREGGSDLYYTSFALRSLALLGELHGEVATSAAQFLTGQLSSQASIVDFLSLIYGASLLEMSAGLNVFSGAAENWRESVSEALETLRRDDGGYAKGPEGAASSTYHTFLVVLCRQLIDVPLTESDRIVEFVLSQQRPDGGFVEIRQMRRSGANPTAAAIGVLRALDSLDSKVAEHAADFLGEMQNDEGGLLANTRIPIADILSTFTGLLTLFDLQEEDCLDLPAVRRYAQSLENEEGGFLGAEWDQAVDVEYSFYGLGTLALLALHDANSKGTG